jgi:hypothetical protein
MLFGGVTKKVVPASRSAIGGYLDPDVFVKAEDTLVAQVFNTHDATTLIWKGTSLPQLVREVNAAGAPPSKKTARRRICRASAPEGERKDFSCSASLSTRIPDAEWLR